ncbi:hypothetical protein B0H10DRAFT_1950344 [Mycena sp. CBHHK59/15]|nr:hypothetical protein B0H10DRAFT_1950344 [Mycena sp. CBHHK59/15]
MSQLTRIRRLRPNAQYRALLALGPTAYAKEGLGDLYFCVRYRPALVADVYQGRTSRAALNTTALQIKCGSSHNVDEHMPQYAVCERTHHPVVFWAYCNVPHRLLAERLVHLKLKAHGAALVPSPATDAMLPNVGGLQSVGEVSRGRRWRGLQFDRILKRRSNDHEGKRLVAGAGKGAGKGNRGQTLVWWRPFPSDLHSEGQMRGYKVAGAGGEEAVALRGFNSTGEVSELEKRFRPAPSDSHLGRVNQREGHKCEAKTGGTDKSAKPAGGLRESNGFGFGTPERFTLGEGHHAGRRRCSGKRWRATMPMVRTIFAVGCVAWASYKDNE